MKGIFYISFCLLFVWTGCAIFDTRDETIPAYLSITSADLQTSTGQGANTSNIVDAIVYANDIYVGTFEMPATVPILESGSTKITVAAGIKNNGMVSDRRIYPFYTFENTEVNLIPDAVTPISTSGNITFSYYASGLHFIIEDFEETGYSIAPLQDNNAALELISTPPQDVKTQTSFLAVLPPDTGRFSMISDWDLTQLPKGKNIYLEIDFKGTVPMEIGIYTLAPYVSKTFALGLNPQKEYTKVYVDLTDEIAPQIEATSFAVYFKASSGNALGADSIFIDNLKFIYP